MTVGRELAGGPEEQPADGAGRARRPLPGTAGPDVAEPAEAAGPRLPPARLVPPAALARLQRSAGNAAVSGALREVFRAGAVQRDGEDAPATGLLVDDGAAAGANQLTRARFLAELRQAVTATADDALAPVGRTAADCPYLEQAFRFYGDKSAAEIEKALRGYAPDAAGATTARDYFPAVNQRVRQGVLRWAGASGEGGDTGAIAAGLAAAGGAVASALTSAASAVTGLLFSRRPGATPAADPAGVRAGLGAGRPLDGAVRGRMEGALGADFGAVRVHDDGTAAGLADQLNARAFTIGTDVAFGAGRYRPGSPVGDALIEHELAHVMQQGSAASAAERGVALDRADRHGVPDDERAVEADADRSATAAVLALWGSARDAAGRVGPSLESGLHLRRCGNLSDTQEKQFLDQARARAGGDLDQQLGSATEELKRLEGAAAEIRARAVAKKFITPQVITPWDRAFRAVVAMQPTVSGGTLDAGQKQAAASAMEEFYAEFRKVVAARDYTVTSGGRSSTTLTKNPFLSEDELKGRSYPLYMDSEGMLKRLRGATTAADWPAVVQDFHKASNGLDRYIGEQFRREAKVAEGEALAKTEAGGAEPIGRLRTALATGTVDAAVRTPAVTAMTDFATSLRSTVAHADYVHRVEPKASRGAAPYLAVTNDFLSQGELGIFQAWAQRASSAGDLTELLSRYDNLTKARDRYLADPKTLGSSVDADKLERAGGLSRGIDELRDQHPDAQKIKCVFYAEPSGEELDAPGYATPPPVPIELFLFRDGDDWKMRDLTSTMEPKENKASANGTDPAPLPDLFEQLDSKLRFPKGLLRWSAPDGRTGEQRTTASRSFSEWLTIAGIVLAAAGLAAATAGASMAATGFIIAASATGAVAAAAAMREKSEQGILTTVDIAVGLATIATEILTATTAGMGKLIISQAGKTGVFAELAVLADRSYAITTKITMGANVVTFITYNIQAAADLQKVEASNASPDEKRVAKERIVQQLMLMGGITLLGIKGDIKGLRAGRSIYLDPDFAKGGMARQLFGTDEILAGAARYGETAELAALLRRTDLPEELGFQLNAELADALRTAKISDEGMRLVLGRLKGGMAAGELQSVITEVRRANRLVYAEVLGDSGKIVIEDVGGRLRARPLLADDDLLRRAKALGTGDSLAQTLARPDLDAALKAEIRNELSTALATGQLDDQGLAKSIGALRRASDARQVQEALAELRHGNRVAAGLRSDAKVMVGAVAGTDYTFGKTTVRIDPMSEVDALYPGNDARIHADEVKNTTNALRDKLGKTPAQLQNLAAWRAAAPGERSVSVVIESEAGWTDLFRPVRGSGDGAMMQLINAKVPLRIAGREWSPEKMQEIWDTILAKGSKGGRPPGPDFFKSIATLDDAQKVLGISL